MEFIYSALVVFLTAYLCGAVPFGYLIGRMNGIDIRKYGSHNIGATNVTRVLGGTMGKLCFAGDFLKGMLPVIIFGSSWCSGWGGVIATAGTVVGHMYSFWMGFRGGKGVATSLGALVALSFWPVLIGALVWYAVYRRTLVVAMASISIAVVIPVSACLLRLLGWHFTAWPSVLLMAVLGGLVIWRHRENIVRMLQGRELGFKPKKR